MLLNGLGFGALRPGDHLCFPYDNEEEKQSTLLAFVREGLARQERCVFIGTPDEQNELLAALEATGVSTERALERGALVLATQKETYLRTGSFDSADALAMIDGLIDRALADGFAGLRASGGASGPVPDELWKQILVYEARLNDLVARRPFIGLCRFHGADISAERVQDMLRTHPLALVRGELCENPYYERPDLALGGDTRARVEWQLHQLRAYHRARKRLEAAAETRHRALSTLASELADPLFALKREVHALGATFDETPSPERIEAATRHLRRLSAAVDQARNVASLVGPSASPMGKTCDLVTLVRDVAARHGVDSIDAPAALDGAWDRGAVERLVSTMLVAALTREPDRAVTIIIRHDEGHATLTFGSGPSAAESGYTVELPRAPARPRG